MHGQCLALHPPPASHSRPSSFGACCETDVLVQEMQTAWILTPPSKPPGVSWGSLVEKDHCTPCPCTINPLVTCIHPGEQVISYQEMCCRNQGAEGSLGSLLPLPKPAIFVRHQVFQEGKLSWWRMWLWRRTGWGLPGVLWSPALWRGVLIIWMPRPSRGNPFDWLITLERVRRSEEGMADKVHWACWMEAKSDWHWPLSPLEVTVAA